MPTVQEMRLLNDAFSGLSDTLLRKKALKQQEEDRTQQNQLAQQLQKERLGAQASESEKDRAAAEKHRADVLGIDKERLALQQQDADLSERHRKIQRGMDEAQTKKLEDIRKQQGEHSQWLQKSGSLELLGKWVKEGIVDPAQIENAMNEQLKGTGLPPLKFQAPPTPKGGMGSVTESEEPDPLDPGKTVWKKRFNRPLTPEDIKAEIENAKKAGQAEPATAPPAAPAPAAPGIMDRLGAMFSGRVGGMANALSTSQPAAAPPAAAGADVVPAGTKPGTPGKMRYSDGSVWQGVVGPDGKTFVPQTRVK